MSCNRNCYFLDKSFVESEPEDTDDDLEDSDDDLGSEDDETDNNTYQQNIKNKCDNCNFEAKSTSGLKIHEKTEHKIQCEYCEFKTTTKLLLKKHSKDLHQK